MKETNIFTLKKEKALKDLFRKHKDIKLAYLFGSIVKGRRSSMSDIDIGILLDQSLSKEDMFNLRLLLISEMTSILNIDKIDLVVMNNASLSLNFEIIKSNHHLYVRDKSKKIDFEHRTLSGYLDRRYYDKRNAEIFISKVAKKGLAF